MANGLRLAYDEFGNAENPAIMLVMGFGTQMVAWPELFCESLANAGYRVIRFDNRDVGLSQKIEARKKTNLAKLLLYKKLGLSLQAPYTLEDMAEDAIGVLDYLEIDSANWVGASMGGMICQIIAAQHPHRSASLTSIMSTSGNPELPQTSWKVLRLLLDRPKTKSEKDYLKHSMKVWSTIGSPDYPPAPDELETRILQSLRRSHYPAGRANQMAALMASGDRRGLLRKISTPALVIHGKSDVLVSHHGGIDTAKHIPHAELKLVDGMGHDLPKELLPKFANWIIKMIQQTK